MTATQRILHAWWDDGTPIGVFAQGQDRRVDFRYADEYHGLPLSASLPPEEPPVSSHAAGNYLENLLPENPAARDRIAREHGLDPADSFGLLTAVGRECAGAVILLPPGEVPGSTPHQYLPLTEEMFERWYETREHQPLLTDRHGRVRLSIAGAQPKAVLRFDGDDRPYLPLDGAATTHLVKPPIRRASLNTVFVEWYCMHLAAAVLGDDAVAATDCWRRCLRVRRFDRIPGATGILRLHQEDLCQALGLAVGQKYEATTKATDPTNTLLARTARLVDRLGEQGRMRSPALQKQALLERLLVNAFILNADAHLKNFGLLYTPDGELRISPMYDVLCTWPVRLREGGDTGWGREPVREIPLDRELPIIIGQARYVDRISDDDWIWCATRQLGLTTRYIQRQLHDIRDRLAVAVRPVADTLLDIQPHAEPALTAVADCIDQHLRRRAIAKNP